jgi:3-deoxy-7-phosphoheptulonate synthase
VERTIVVVLTEMEPAAVAGVDDAGRGSRFHVRPSLWPAATSPENTVVRIGAVELGTSAVSLVVGIRFVEEDSQVSDLVQAALGAGAGLVRVSVGSRARFPHGAEPQPEALRRRAVLTREAGLPVLAQVRSEEEAIAVASVAQGLYLGGQDMGNAALLRCCASTGLPVVLERGLSAGVEEWLMAAEYVLALGHSQIVLCEAGIRTFEPGRTLDLSSLPLVRRLSHLPLIADPTSVGASDLMGSLALAAVGAGADAVVLEATTDAAAAGGRALPVEALSPLTKRMAPLCRALGRVPPLSKCQDQQLSRRPALSVRGAAGSRQRHVAVATDCRFRREWPYLGF